MPASLHQSSFLAHHRGRKKLSQGPDRTHGVRPEKLKHYNGQNLLARSLHRGAYDHNPGFRRFLDDTGLPFTPHDHFKRADLDSRQELYGLLAERIWNPSRVTADAAAVEAV
jgi:hypothetical protein